MKSILRIAKTELFILFYSPIAWLLLGVFAFQCALSFTENTQLLVNEFRMNVPVTGSLTYNLLLPFYTSGVRDNLYFYMPLITMGLMSREMQSGSIKLLQSSPVSTVQIVIGKYLGVISFGLLLVSVILIFTVIGDAIIVHSDLSYSLSGITGFYSLICTYCAIGLLMSCLTSYQVVASITTFAALASLNYMNHVWQDKPFFRHLTKIISMADRSDDFLEGLISSKNLFYFLIIISMSLGIAIIYLQARQHHVSLRKRIFKYSSLIAILLLAGFLTSKPYFTGYYDMTANKSKTVSGRTREILSRIKSPLELKAYGNLLDYTSGFAVPAETATLESIFEPYQRFLNHDIHFAYTYYYDTSDDLLNERKQARTSRDNEIATKIAESDKIDFSEVLSPKEIRSQIDLIPEKGRLIWKLTNEDHTARLRVFKDMIEYPFEQEIADALKWLMDGQCKVLMVTGHGERNTVDGSGTQDYQNMMTEVTDRSSLVNHGFEFSEFSIDSSAIVPEDGIMVIADPKTPMSTTALEKIKRYITGGGNLLITAEPGRKQLLNPLLSELGVRYTSDRILQADRNYDPDYLFGHFDPASAELSLLLGNLGVGRQAFTIPSAVSIETIPGHGFAIHPIIKTDSNTWIRDGYIKSDSGYVNFDPWRDDKKQVRTVIAALTRNIHNKEQRIIVAGDADFLSNAEIKKINFNSRNGELATAIFGWLSNDRFPVNTSLPAVKDLQFRIVRSDLPILKILTTGVLPLLLMMSGTVLLIVRKRR